MLGVGRGEDVPPREAADPDRIPGFLGVLGPDGPLGYATNVRINERNDASGKPTQISIAGAGPGLDVTVRFDVASTVVSQRTQAGGLDFLQMRGSYTVDGRAGGKPLQFIAAGAAETFRGNR